MSKHRYIKDSFWTDPYIEKLTPDYKLVFLYLLTNPMANISGVYEIRIKRIAYETGYDQEVIETIFKKFVKDKKIIRFKDWIVVINHIKHQSLGDSTAIGMEREIKLAPTEVQSLFDYETLVNSKGNEYRVPFLSDNMTPPIDPLPTPPFGAYSEVKLSKVISKDIYGEHENVKLTSEEYQKLKEKLGDTTDTLIEELSSYMASKGKRYASHYATIQTWARMREQKQKDTKNYKTKDIINI